MKKVNKINYDVKDLSLAEQGKLNIEWAAQQMPVLNIIKKRFSREKPLKGLTIAACLHVTKETANLVLTLKEGGANILLCASNPLSTQDDIASSLVKDFEIPVFAIKGEDNKTYYKHLNEVLDSNPQITMDDGADLVSMLHKERRPQAKNIIGSSEETTTGVIRLKAMEKDKELLFPVVAVNDSDTKHLFDNRYGTGQSSIDGIIRATNLLLAGKNFVVCGYGWCSKGVAMRAKGMGANVIVTEIDPVKALEAVMDGFQVMKIGKALKVADIAITATGNKNVISEKMIENMKDGIVLANTGHFNVEINTEYLEKVKKSKRNLRNSLDEYVLRNGKKVYLLADGRLVNLAAAEGHPAEVMDMSFANQAYACEWLLDNKGKLKNKVYALSEKIDHSIASLKLFSMGVSFDRLTAEQKKYLSSWQEGT
ncbi:adenosylhomocysteinase [Candidatus Parcubacteria bacterium]|nr:MAG: adenosylhomocysteinase [Candidatus Parcubacteria bacterium]